MTAKGTGVFDSNRRRIKVNYDPFQVRVWNGVIRFGCVPKNRGPCGVDDTIVANRAASPPVYHKDSPLRGLICGQVRRTQVEPVTLFEISFAHSHEFCKSCFKKGRPDKIIEAVKKFLSGGNK